MVSPFAYTKSHRRDEIISIPSRASADTRCDDIVSYGEQGSSWPIFDLANWRRHHQKQSTTNNSPRASTLPLFCI